jgi:catechol 2,3-dioxygenase-like lactoylglutathione lyase family enzyme
MGMQSSELNCIRLDNFTAVRESARYAGRDIFNAFLVRWGLLGLLLAASLALTAFPAVAAVPGESAPGILGMDHIGVTVPDLAQAESFFVDIIGCRTFTRVPLYHAKTGWVTNKNAEGVGPKSEMVTTVQLRCGNGSNLELFAYQNMPGRIVQPEHQDVGWSHIAFYSADFPATIAYLKAKGVKLMAPPSHVTEGDNKGENWAYFLTPWGMQIEINNYPPGKGYEQRDPGHRLWSPQDAVK